MRYPVTLSCMRSMRQLDCRARRARARGRTSMHSLSNAARSAALATLCLSLVGGAAVASDNHIVVAPGGPHPYFAPWEQAAADAQKDFGIASVKYRVPSDWKLELQTELMESLASQGVNGLGIFPGDPVGVNSTIAELKTRGIPVV